MTGLEALNGLFDLVTCQGSFEKAQRCFDIVEQALLRLESIDNANPSKAINSLEFICKILNEKRIDVKWLFKGDYNIIVQALLRLESIDNANPSEALNVLKATEKYTGIDLTVVKNALLKAQENEKAIVEKELKAFKIIKEKRVDIESFYTTFIENSYNYNFYEISYGTYGKYKLTQEEFNLLKEVLE